MDESINTAAPAGVSSQSANQPTNSVPGAAPGETVAETMKRMHKVTVDGTEMEVDEDELRRGYAHNKAAAKRMEEASMTRKEAEQVLRTFKENPAEAFRLLGLDPRKFSEDIINNELAEALMSPQEKELRDYKNRAEKYEGAQRRAQQEYEAQQAEQQMASMMESIQTDIITTAQSSGLPSSPEVIESIIYYMRAAEKAGFANVGAKDVIDQVKSDWKHRVNSVLGQLPEEVLEEWLGDNYKRIARSSVKVPAGFKAVDKSVNAGRTPRVDTNERKVMSPKDYFKRR